MNCEELFKILYTQPCNRQVGIAGIDQESSQKLYFVPISNTHLEDEKLFLVPVVENAEILKPTKDQIKHLKNLIDPFVEKEWSEGRVIAVSTCERGCVLTLHDATEIRVEVLSKKETTNGS